jgi:hypothetical protein
MVRVIAAIVMAAAEITVPATAVTVATRPPVTAPRENKEKE